MTDKKEQMKAMDDEQLEKAAGGNYGGSSGHWVPASITAKNGIHPWLKTGGSFVEDPAMTIPYGTDLTVDMNTKKGKYAAAFYDGLDIWIDLKKGVEII